MMAKLHPLCQWSTCRVSKLSLPNQMVFVNAWEFATGCITPSLQPLNGRVGGCYLNQVGGPLASPSVWFKQRQCRLGLPRTVGGWDKMPSFLHLFKVLSLSCHQASLTTEKRRFINNFAFLQQCLTASPGAARLSQSLDDLHLQSKWSGMANQSDSVGRVREGLHQLPALFPNSAR